jgi:glycosyltransferase involved in cell wall biosynthesis
MGAKQGLENVVEAARVSQARGGPVHYVLLGDGNQRPAVERLAVGIPTISFLPPADSDTYPDILGAADALLVNERPGVAEMSLPSKLTSYCAAGRPVLAAVDGLGAAAEVVRASGAGVVVTPGRPEQLHDAALELSLAPGRAASMGGAGRAYAAKHYGAADAMAGYDRWLTALAGTAFPQLARRPSLR